MSERPASEVYQPAEPNQLIDEPEAGNYRDFGYAIAYEVGPDDAAAPEGGNTAIFRIHPGGMTEPVFVTKPEAESTFTVSVVRGQGEVICARADGTVESVALEPGSDYVVRPGDAYSYINTSDENDLILHDEARPAFREGDEVKLLESAVPATIPALQPGFAATVIRTAEGGLGTIPLPQAFFDRVAEHIKH